MNKHEISAMRNHWLMRIFILVIIAGFRSTPLLADDAIIIPVSAYEYLNTLRKQAGMAELKTNDILNRAASNHANYCVQNRVGGHFEMKSGEGYTGHDHIARTIAAGYNSRSTGENVSVHLGVANDKASVDGLMSAIYHRFGFLNLEYDEIGIGKINKQDFTSYVYNLGSSEKTKLCRNKNFNQSGKYYNSVCNDIEFRVSAHDFEKVINHAMQKNPAIVLWPPANSIGVSPAFYEESPDPLPEHGVSGYPVSIEFNPAFFAEQAPVVTRFDLIDVETGASIEIIKRIDKASDLNHKFTDYQHAIFPLQRLEWGSEYRVQLSYLENDENKNMEWSFTTRELGVPLYTVIENNTVIREKEGSSFVVYLPPKHSNDTVMAYGSQYHGFSLLEVQLIDGNTLIIKSIGKGEAEISFHEMKFKVII